MLEKYTQTHTNKHTHVVQPDYITNTNARGSAYIHIAERRRRNGTIPCVCVATTKSYRSVGNYLGNSRELMEQKGNV